jgi:hypothetical protein
MAFLFCVSTLYDVCTVTEPILLLSGVCLYQQNSGTAVEGIEIKHWRVV